MNGRGGHEIAMCRQAELAKDLELNVCSLQDQVLNFNGGC